MLTQDFKRRNPKSRLIVKPHFEERVAILKFYPGMDSGLIDWLVDKSYRGLILEGSGLGHIRRRCFDSLQNAVGGGVIVGMTSQCIWGRTNMNVYNTGRDLLALGIVSLEDILPETALVKLMWVLGQTSDTQEAKKMLKTNLAGELSPITLPEEVGAE
jgi:glutamyl-tRNA(Gln) amidotransferase subunit D